jgi:hypothetical protein
MAGVAGVAGGVTRGVVDGLIWGVPFEKSMEDVEVVNSARGEGGDGKHALFEPNAKAVFTAFDLSSPIIYLSTYLPDTKCQIALRR